MPEQNCADLVFFQIHNDPKAAAVKFQQLAVEAVIQSVQTYDAVTAGKHAPGGTCAAAFIIIL